MRRGIQSAATKATCCVTRLGVGAGLGCGKNKVLLRHFPGPVTAMDPNVWVGPPAVRDQLNFMVRFDIKMWHSTCDGWAMDFEWGYGDKH